MIDAGKMRMPKQEVADGQKHGYIGEEDGLVETYDAPKGGSSNAVPDLETAQARVDAAKLALRDAERGLADAQKAKKPDANKPDTNAKPPAGATAGGGTS